jgi:hypothetical protein
MAKRHQPTSSTSFPAALSSTTTSPAWDRIRDLAESEGFRRAVLAQNDCLHAQSRR